MKITTKRFVASLILFLLFFSVNAWAGSGDFKQVFTALPGEAVNSTNPLNDAKVELGKMLYFDPRLSKSGFISCSSCHNLATGGVDNLPTSIGHGWQSGPRNAPTVLNAALLGTQFWDGRAADVEEQAGGPILNPGEMGATEELVLKRIGSMKAYVELFGKAFKSDKNPLKYENVAKAIAAFERTLLTPSRFDDYLNGDMGALSASELKGLGIFIDKGCAGCHNGVAVGGNSFQKFNYGDDLGREEVTKDKSDRRVFRVASLRNVSVTYPYFHDGKVWDLKEAVMIMGEKQLGVKLTSAEADALVSFLGSLTGRLAPVTLPTLPPSNQRTPRPDRG